MSKIVQRTMAVFEVFARIKKPQSLTELAKELEIPVSSCHDVVHALEEAGYLYEVRPRGGFYPTAKLYELASTTVKHDPIVERSESTLNQLCLDLSASVSLSKARGFQLTYLVVCNSPDPLRFTVTVGTNSRNLYATSAGKALLGSYSEEEQASYLNSIEMTSLTPYTITDPARLISEIRESVRRGWYLNREESVEDALTISTSFSWHGSLYVITAAGTRNRMERQFDHAVTELKRAALQLQQGGS